jgi:hypothetical protein
MTEDDTFRVLRKITRNEMEAILIEIFPFWDDPELFDQVDAICPNHSWTKEEIQNLAEHL